jgi:hypothetical protein
MIIGNRFKEIDYMKTAHFRMYNVRSQLMYISKTVIIGEFVSKIGYIVGICRQSLN